VISVSGGRTDREIYIDFKVIVCFNFFVFSICRTMHNQGELCGEVQWAKGKI
jgi:hypothetical protein